MKRYVWLLYLVLPVLYIILMWPTMSYVVSSHPELTHAHLPDMTIEQIKAETAAILAEAGNPSDARRYLELLMRARMLGYACAKQDAFYHNYQVRSFEAYTNDLTNRVYEAFLLKFGRDKMYEVNKPHWQAYDEQRDRYDVRGDGSWALVPHLVFWTWPFAAIFFLLRLWSLGYPLLGEFRYRGHKFVKAILFWPVQLFTYPSEEPREWIIHYGKLALRFAGGMLTASLSLFAAGIAKAQTVQKPTRDSARKWGLQIDTRLAAIAPGSGPDPQGFLRVTATTPAKLPIVIESVNTFQPGLRWNELGVGPTSYRNHRVTLNALAGFINTSAGTWALFGGGQVYVSTKNFTMGMPSIRLERQIVPTARTTFAFRTEASHRVHGPWWLGGEINLRVPFGPTAATSWSTGPALKWKPNQHLVVEGAFLYNQLRQGLPRARLIYTF